MSRQKIDLTGKRFGRLTVKGVSHRNEKHVYYWDCICDCGNRTVVTGNNLKSGNVRSCGCLGRECKPPIQIKHGNLKYGEKREKLYNIWVAMKQRCYNPNDANYHRYGGRGITVCDEWRNDYSVFKEWCLTNGYKEKLDLDRRDNDGNYEPSNCRFVSHKENLCNTHRKLHDVINGEDITLVAAAEKYGFTYQCLYTRYKRGKRGEELVERN